MLSEAWNFKVGSYVLTTLSGDGQGDLSKMAKIISKYTSIAGCLTLDAKRDEFVRRTLFTLPAGVSRELLDTVVTKLEKKGFIVSEIEDLQSGQAIRSDDQPYA